MNIEVCLRKVAKINTLPALSVSLKSRAMRTPRDIPTLQKYLPAKIDGLFERAAVLEKSLRRVPKYAHS